MPDNERMKPLGKTYSRLIKFGRLLENHSLANQMSDEKPEIIFNFVTMIDKELRFASVDDFFSLFPPIKRYKNDGMWDYKSTMEMRINRLGTHFGKNDFKHLIMTTCYENKWLHLIGISFMWSMSRIHKNQTGREMLIDFLENQSKK